MLPVRPARGLVRKFLLRQKHWAITLPPMGIYVLEEHLQDTGLIAHEQVHAKQAAELGCIRFYAQYLWYQVQYGYEGNPMEVEARNISGRR